jgi:HEAT repeat protein
MQAAFPALLVMVSWLQLARADEQRTFCGKTVEGWREVLRDKAGTAGGRQQALQALGCFGPEALPAVPDLIEAVRHGPLKDEAVDALVRIGSGAEVTVPILIQRFLKRGCGHRTGMGTFFVDDSMEESLVRIGGPAVPALLEVLKGPDKDVRVCAAAVLGRIAPAARAAVPALIRTIEHSDTDRQTVILRSFAIRALGRIGPEARAAVPVLTRHLDEALKHVPHEGQVVAFGGRRVAFELATALDRIGAPPVQKLLDTFLRAGDSLVAHQLAWLGARAREATPSLRSALSDKRLRMRIAAAVALAHIEPSATEAIPVLIEGLNHLDDETPRVVVREVPRALARMGPKARPAIPKLIGLVKNECDDPNIHMALVQIDPEGKECVPALISALDHQDYQVVDVAANCLGLLGPCPKDAVATLAATVTRDFDHEVFYNGVDPQVSAAKALRRIGPGAKAAIPALIGALKYRRVVRPRDEREYRDPWAAWAAAETLSSFGAEATAAIPALIEAVQTSKKDDQDWLVHRAAILTLGRMGPNAKAAIAVLRNLIRDDDEPSEYLAEAIAAISQVAPDGKQLAAKWLAKPPSGRVGWQKSPFSHPPPLHEVEGRALVLGVMGRTSVEGDGLTRSVLERLDWLFAQADPRAGEPPMQLEEWFELLGRLGVGGRLAIPRLNEFRAHPNPWVRMWATDALSRISLEDHSVTVHSGLTQPARGTQPNRDQLNRGRNAWIMTGALHETWVRRP